VVPVSEPDNGMKVYLLSCEDVEKLLVARYGKKLTAVNHAKLAKAQERRANWLKHGR
jgi:hypothetical protein